ncbi:MAG: AzlC family ABC transporter permease [Peptococcaceae bacterium]|jgi:4-azaleucine resistance transporter AzlC|nr:AzlC family ABC transporter permease [Peptococcaceae bacterium]
MSDARQKALKAAFPYTLPVLTGFLVLGIAYGILMSSKGYGLFWPGLVSVFVFAGSMQFVAVGMMAGGFDPVAVLLMTLMVNARHIFYGLSMLEKYRNTGWMKGYLIFGLCDETYSILCATDPPEGVDRRWFMFFITFLNHSYWVAGSFIGGFVGMAIPFEVAGIDFALTALFVVILIGQWQGARNRLPTVIGVAGSVVCRLLFGSDRFLIPAMLVILLSVTALRKPLDHP